MPRKRLVVLETEREMIAQQMQGAFSLLAKERGHAFNYSGFDKPEKGRKLLRDCGNSVSDQILQNDEHLEAYDALRRLLEHQALPLDLAEFVFNCVSGVPSTVAGKLENAGFSSTELRKMADACDRLQERFDKLNCEAIPGPLSYLFHVQKLPPGHKTLMALEKVPEYLAECSKVLRRWPPSDYTSQLNQRGFGKHYLTAYFRIYVVLLGGNEGALAALLRLMRDAFFHVYGVDVRIGHKALPNAKLTYPFLQYARKEDKDPLSSASLRMSLDRFFDRNPGLFGRMLFHVGNYLREPQYKDLRNKHHTFLELLETF